MRLSNNKVGAAWALFILMSFIMLPILLLTYRRSRAARERSLGA